MMPSTSLPPAVLVVEDEAIIRINAVDMFEDAGFRVYEAGSVEGAIALLERHDDIVLVFTDINLIGTATGLELAHMVRKRWPPVALIVVSGRYTGTVEDLPEAAVFLPKPYRASHVHGLIRQLTAVDLLLSPDFDLQKPSLRLQHRTTRSRFAMTSEKSTRIVMKRPSHRG